MAWRAQGKSRRLTRAAFRVRVSVRRARPPRAWLERTANVVRVTEPARGGHFAPFEEPRLYVEELRAFFRPYRVAAATD